MATIIIFASLSVLSLIVMLFLIKRQVAHIGLLPSYYLDGVEPIWKDVYNLIRRLLHKFWIKNAHKIEFLLIVLGKVVIRSFARIENVILQFLNFIWGKCKIEKNNSSHYWQMMIRHKNDLSEDEDEDSDIGGKDEGERDIDADVREKDTEVDIMENKES